MEARNPRYPHRSVERVGQGRKRVKVGEERFGKDAPKVARGEMPEPRVPEVIDVVIGVEDRHREGARPDKRGQKNERRGRKPGLVMPREAVRALLSSGRRLASGGWPIGGRLPALATHRPQASALA